MFGLKPVEIILLLAVGYLFYDKFKVNKPVANTAVIPLNGASVNTAPSIISNSNNMGDNFDLQVEMLTRQLGY